MKIRAMVATDQEPLENGRFSSKALDIIRTTSIGVQVLLNFDPDKKVGEIVGSDIGYPSAKCETGRAVFCEAEIVCPLEIPDTLYLVPGFCIDTQNYGGEAGLMGRIIEDIILFAFGLTAHPTDKNLTPIEIVK